jgi:hypothetical protein
MRKSILHIAAIAVALCTAIPSAMASTLNFGINWGPTGSPDPLVGLAVKVNFGSASVQSITGGTTYGLPSGWGQQTLADSFLAGSNPTASPSQYGFVRGGGGLTHGTADSYTGPIGFDATFALDDGYTPANGDGIQMIFAFFKADGALSVQGLVDWTYNSGTSSWDRQVYFNDAIGYWPWAQTISGSFDEFSAAVVPLPSGVLMGLAGLGIVAIRRRRH